MKPLQALVQNNDQWANDGFVTFLKHNPMKNLFKVALVAAGIFSFSASQAQTHKDSSVGHKIGTTAKKVGHKTSEIAATGASDVVAVSYTHLTLPTIYSV